MPRVNPLKVKVAQFLARSTTLSPVANKAGKPRRWQHWIELTASQQVVMACSLVLIAARDCSSRHGLSQRPIFPSFGRVIPFVDG